MYKQQMIERINTIPRFELRNVAVGAPLTDTDYETQWERTGEHRAVCIVGTQDPLAIVSPEYCLVQFADTYLPILSPLDVKDGKVVYYDGYGIMTVYPEGDEYSIDNDTEIGLSVHNSVNKKSGLSIKFVVRSKDKVFTIPKKMAQFRRIHVGKIQQSTKDYVAVAIKIRSEWSTVLSKFNKATVRDDEFDAFCETLGLGEQLAKKLSYHNHQTTTMWDLMMHAFDMLSAQKYKSEIHKQQKLDEYCEALFTYGMVAKLQ